MQRDVRTICFAGSTVLVLMYFMHLYVCVCVCVCVCVILLRQAFAVKVLSLFLALCAPGGQESDQGSLCRFQSVREYSTLAIISLL